MAQAYSLDATRTTVAGHSMGSTGATRFATNHPDVFAAVGIVSGAGYMSASGGRNAEDDITRVENLSAMRVFLDAGTSDVAQVPTQTWDAAFDAADVAHRTHYYGGAEHGDFRWLGWRQYAEHLAGAERETSPSRR